MRTRRQTPETPEQRAAGDLARRRRKYAHAANSGITPEEALASARAVLDGSGVRGMREPHDSGLGRYVDREWERGWGVSCRVTVRLEQDYAARVVDPDDPREAVLFYRPSVELGWSSTGRSVATARAAVRLYGDVTDLAAEVLSVLEERPIRSLESLAPSLTDKDQAESLAKVADALSGTLD